MNAIAWMVANRKRVLPVMTYPEGYSRAQARLGEKIVEHLRKTPGGATEEDLMAVTGYSKHPVRRALGDLVDVRLEMFKKVNNGRCWYRMKGRWN